MSTIYTVNGKVLKNSDTNKWLIKKEAPVFILNPSNTVYTGVPSFNNFFAIWDGPEYPNACNLDGKEIQLIVSDTLSNENGMVRVEYGKELPPGSQYGGPIIKEFQNCSSAGTYSLTCDANPAEAGGYGTYIAVEFKDLQSSDLQKIEIRIIG